MSDAVERITSADLIDPEEYVKLVTGRAHIVRKPDADARVRHLVDVDSGQHYRVEIAELEQFLAKRSTGN